MNEQQYVQLDGLALVELLERKEVTAQQLVALALKRIKRLNPQLNAVIHTFEPALQESGALHGLPFLLKNIGQAIAGQPLTAGSRSLVSLRSEQNSTYVETLRTAGATFIGQTNVPEFGLMGITEPTQYGPTRNPWNVNYTPGGSSGGSGAAVAAGFVPIAGASDGGGSIRIPAAYCGLVGLKPTRGRTPVGPLAGRFWQGAAVDHVLTKSVRDSAWLLDHLQLYERTAAFHTPVSETSFLASLQAPLKPLRIGFTVEAPTGTNVAPSCRDAVMTTVRYLETLGHRCEEVKLPTTANEYISSYMTMYFGEVAATMRQIEQRLGRKLQSGEVEATTALLGQIGRKISAEQFVMSLHYWDVLAYKMEQLHETYDVILTPTTAFPAAKIGELDQTASEKWLIQFVNTFGLANVLLKAGIVDQIAAKSLERTPFTQLANLTGQPAISVPVAKDANGIPLGVQAMASRGNEALLLQFAHQLEQSPLWINVHDNPFMAQ